MGIEGDGGREGESGRKGERGEGGKKMRAIDGDGGREGGREKERGEIADNIVPTQQVRADAVQSFQRRNGSNLFFFCFMPHHMEFSE